jgi:hypothetical protein
MPASDAGGFISGLIALLQYFEDIANHTPIVFGDQMNKGHQTEYLFYLSNILTTIRSNGRPLSLQAKNVSQSIKRKEELTDPGVTQKRLTAYTNYIGTNHF